MARFKASRFLKSPKMTKIVDKSAESPDEESTTSVAPPEAKVVEPMQTRPVVSPPKSHVDPARRVDPGEVLRRVDPQDSPVMASQAAPSMQARPASSGDSKLVEEKVDSSATSVADERGSGEKMDPGSVGAAGDYDVAGVGGKPVEDYSAADFGSRSSAEGFGRFDDAAADDSPAGAGRIPSGTLGESVGSSLAGDESTLVDPSDLTNDGPEMPANFDQSRGYASTADLSGMAQDVDERGSNSMADASGIAEGDPVAEGDPDATTSSASNTQSEDDYGKREYLKGNSDGAGQTPDVDNMSDQDVNDAVATEADYETAIKPGKEYLKERDYDVDKMSNDEIVDAIDKEAAYEFSGGEDGTATSPGYVDADSGGERSAQVDADAAKLGIPTTPVRGNIDPTEFGNGAEEMTDTSTLGVSDPVNPADSSSFGGGSIGTPPPRAGVDFGPDHVDQNPGGGQSDDIGGYGIGHDDGTLDVDFSTEASSLIDDLSQLNDPSRMADTPDIGFAIDPEDEVVDGLIDVASDDVRHIDRVDDIFE